MTPRPPSPLPERRPPTPVAGSVATTVVALSSLTRESLSRAPVAAVAAPVRDHYERHFPLDARLAQCARLCLGRADTVPVVVEGGTTNPKLYFLALPLDACVSDLAAAVREQADLPVRQPLSLSVDGCTPAATTTVGDLHAACVREDGLLHVRYRVERRLGSSTGAAAAGSCVSASQVANGGRSWDAAPAAAHRRAVSIGVEPTSTPLTAQQQQHQTLQPIHSSERSSPIATGATLLPFASAHPVEEEAARVAPLSPTMEHGGCEAAQLTPSLSPSEYMDSGMDRERAQRALSYPHSHSVGLNGGRGNHFINSGRADSCDADEGVHNGGASRE